MANIDLRLALPDEVQHLAVGSRPIKVKCREHNDKQESLAVYADGLYCFGCEFKLQHDLVEALAYLLRISYEDARKAAPRYTTEAVDAYRDRVGLEARRDPLPLALAQAYHQVLLTTRRHRLDWLYARGLDDRAIADGWLGHDGFRFVIPVFDRSGQLLTLRFRRDDEYGTKRPKYCGLPGRNGLYLYPEWLLAGDDPPRVLYLCEGELDALRLWQAGAMAVTVTNGAGQLHKAIGMLKDLAPLQELRVCADQDEAGEEAARVTLETAVAAGLNARRVHWDTGKDVTEALQLGQSLQLGPLVGASGIQLSAA